MFHDIRQNTDEWLLLRSGHVTGSAISKIMASSRDYTVLSLGKAGFGIADNIAKKVFAKRYESKIEADKALVIMKKKDLRMSFGIPAKQLAANIAVGGSGSSRKASVASRAHRRE